MTDRRDMPDRRDVMTAADRFRLMGDWLKWLLGMGISAFVAYNVTVNGMRDETRKIEQRIAIQESKQQATDSRLERIENKIDLLIQRPQ